MILKVMEYLVGFSTELKIIKKERIFKWHPMCLKPNSEKMWKDYTKLEQTEVLGINGDLRLEDNIPRQQGEEEEL